MYQDEDPNSALLVTREFSPTAAAAAPGEEAEDAARRGGAIEARPWERKLWEMPADEEARGSRHRGGG